MEMVKKVLAWMQPSPAEKKAHAVPLWLLTAVFLALLFFTWMTTFVTRFDLGNFNLYLALLIAVIKATIVSLYFMHLRWDRPFNGYIFMGAIIFVALFVAFVLTDSHRYQPSIIWEEKKPIPAAAEAPGASEIDTHSEPATDTAEPAAGEPGGALPGDAAAAGDSSGGH